MGIVIRTIVGICAVATIVATAPSLCGAEAARPTAEVVNLNAASRTLTLRGMDGQTTTYAVDAGLFGKLETGEMIAYEAAEGRIVTIVRVGTKPRLDLE